MTPDELPMLAPCRHPGRDAPLRWLKNGLQDVRAAPRQSLGYGLLVVILSYLITAATWYYGNMGLYLGLVSGFVFVGPWVALTLYAISIRLQRGEPVFLRRSMRDAGRALGNTMVFAVILTVIFLVWARAATVVHVFFPQIGDPALKDLIVFLLVGSAVGAIFCAIIFAASAFSLPMLMDRQVDTVTAVVTSVNAVLRNKGTMLVWAMMIGGVVLVGVLTAWLAFVVLIPLMGHATWHAYQDTIDAAQWPVLPLEDGTP